MARVADHLSVEDLEARLRSAQDPTATRHVQVIWLLARGHTIAEVAAVTSFVPRWIEQLLARYNAMAPRPWVTCVGAMGAHRACCALSFWRGCPSGFRRLRPTVACGPAPRWRPGWRANSGSLRSCLNAAGRRSRRSTGRCRSRARAILPRPRPRSGGRLKKAGAGRRRGAGPAPGHAGRGLGHGRAPHWPEADPAPGLGAQRSAADRPRPPPLQVALRHRLRPPNLRRDLLVRVERRVQAVLRRAPGVVCPRGRGGTRAHDRARARQRRLAHRAEPGRARWDPACLLAPVLPRASARRAPVACPR